MSPIGVSSSAEKPGATAGLYLADPASERLLLVIGTNMANEPDVAALAKTLGTEGWSVLHLTCAETIDAEAAAAEITDALVHAAARLASRPRIVAVADGAAACPACTAVLRSHRQAALPLIEGLVTVDAFATAASAALGTELADIDGLATVIAARRANTETRRSGLSVHQRLQSNGRESHYLVLADNDASLLEQLADATGALGRDVRWLLDPVHSRNGA